MCDKRIELTAIYDVLPHQPVAALARAFFIDPVRLEPVLVGDHTKTNGRIGQHLNTSTTISVHYNTQSAIYPPFELG